MISSTIDHQATPARADDAPRSVPTLSPSALGLFFAHEQCQRFLRLTLMSERERDQLLTAEGVIVERIPPVLRREGESFEAEVYEALRARHPIAFRCSKAASVKRSSGAPVGGFPLLKMIERVDPGTTNLLAQYPLTDPFPNWQVNGQPDLVVAQRDGDGNLHLLVCDIKASREPRLEHRLQVAMYARMLGAALPDARIQQGVIYRPPASAGAVPKNYEADLANAHDWLGIGCALLSVAEDTAQYDAMLDRVLLAEDSLAAEVLATPLDELPFHVERKCDVCVYNELCLKRCRTQHDLSLIPFLTEQDKRVLHAHGVRTVRELAHLAEEAPEREAALRHAWPVGARMGELTERAAAYLKWQREDVEVSDYLRERGYSTLPAVSASMHPNLIQIFIDAQSYDVEDRLYLLGALVRGHDHGETSATRTRSVVELAERAPASDEEEADLLKRWLQRLLVAVREVASPTVSDRGRLAPIHLYIFERETQRRLLCAIERHADNVLGIEALFHLLMQRAAFDTGNVSVLATEIERQWNLPMLCQSLQAVAAYKGFDWNAERPLRATFKHRMFDQLGVETVEDQPLFSPRRSRFKSDIPIEYPYLAWTGADGPSNGDFAPYGQPTLQELAALERRRLEAMAYLTGKLRANAQTTKNDFDLTKVLQGSSIRPKTVLSAMKNFVVVERHSVLNEWRATRFLSPERRVLQGETLIGVYRESDQDLEVRKELRESAEKYEREVADWQRKVGRGEADERFQPSWTPPDVTIRLELTREALDSDPAQARRRSTLKPDMSVVVAPRWTTDTRPGADPTLTFAPTARQLMLALRGRMGEITERHGRWWVDVGLEGGQFGPEGFVFSARLARPLVDGQRYTLDSDPTSWPEANRLNVIEEVDTQSDGQPGLPHPFADWLGDRPGLEPDWPDEAKRAQRRFFEGLVALLGLTFEADKRRYIAELGEEPVLLVQGPPGTGKSFTSAYAILARVQGAMAAGIPFRVAVSCVTHSATDVLLEKIGDELAGLRQVRERDPEPFDRFFDPRLLNLSVLRYISDRDAGQRVPPAGCHAFQHKEGPARVNQLMRSEYAVVGGTPGQIRKLGKAGIKGKHGPVFDLVVVDEASQMTAPDALQATMGLKPTGRVVFVGDHRQMAPVVHHGWEEEAEITFDPYAMHRSIFDLIRLERETPWVKFPRSFRLHRDVAEFLRHEIYRHDEIDFHSEAAPRFEAVVAGNPLVEATLNGGHAMVVIVHEERQSQQRNDLERAVVTDIYKGLLGRRLSRDDHSANFGVVVPHRAQRADLRDDLIGTFGEDRLAHDVDTVERFQGGERDVIIVSATESDPAYLRASGDFLFDPRRLNVALSRAKQKLIVIAARSVFDYLPADEEQLAKTGIWRNLLAYACTERLWSGEMDGHRVEVFGNPPLAPVPTGATVS